MPTKQVGDEWFTQIEEISNGWFESNQKGEPIFNRGEIETAKSFAKAFPDWEVRVTIGPWRGYDISYDLDLENKVIKIDLYSPRPGIRYVPELIKEVKAKLSKTP